MFVCQPKLTPNSQASFPLFPSGSAGFCEEDVEVEAALGESSWRLTKLICIIFFNHDASVLVLECFGNCGILPNDAERFATFTFIRAAAPKRTAHIRTFCEQVATAGGSVDGKSWKTSHEARCEHRWTSLNIWPLLNFSISKIQLPPPHLKPDITSTHSYRHTCTRKQHETTKNIEISEHINI